MMVGGVSEAEVRRAVRAGGHRFLKPPGWWPGIHIPRYITFTIVARSREERRRRYADICRTIWTLNPGAEIPPCVCGDRVYPPQGAQEQPTVTPEQTLAAAGLDEGQWAAYNRKYCALLGGVK